jgi:hypothetical protein
MPNLQHVENFLANPGQYQDWVYQADPDTYTAVPVYQAFRELMKRDPTPQELAIYQPLVVSSGHSGAKAEIAKFAQQEQYRAENSPEALTKRRNEEIAGKAPQYAGTVKESIQKILSRGANQKEVDYFSKLLASGELDPYELDQFVQQMPEYRQQQDQLTAEKRTTEDKAARESLNTELTKYDQEYFNKSKEDVISRFAQANRLNSPALDYALTDLMGKISSERSRTLAEIARRDYESGRGYGREDYLTNKGLLREDYMGNLNRMYSDQDYNRGREDNLTDVYRDRNFEVQDYYTQQRDYMNALQKIKTRRSGGAGAGIGTLAGLGIGAALAAPTGGMSIPMGAALGSSFGQAGGGMFDYYNQ